MEDGLGDGSVYPYAALLCVLILVLVEDGLGACEITQSLQYGIVLILVLVEDGLGVTPQRPLQT